MFIGFVNHPAYGATALLDVLDYRDCRLFARQQQSQLRSTQQSSNAIDGTGDGSNANRGVRVRVFASRSGGIDDGGMGIKGGQKEGKAVAARAAAEARVMANGAGGYMGVGDDVDVEMATAGAGSPSAEGSCYTDGGTSRPTHRLHRQSCQEQQQQQGKKSAVSSLASPSPPCRTCCSVSFGGNTIAAAASPCSNRLPSGVRDGGGLPFSSSPHSLFSSAAVATAAATPTTAMLGRPECGAGINRNSSSSNNGVGGGCGDVAVASNVSDMVARRRPEESDRDNSGASLRTLVGRWLFFHEHVQTIKLAKVGSEVGRRWLVAGLLVLCTLSGRGSGTGALAV